jgi:AraC family transcriptional regulator of adaptative response / DNA-3-methyladenine glycosylase II
LSYLQARAIPGIEEVTNNGYARTIEINGARGTVAVQTADGNALRATIRFPKLSALPTIIARLRRAFDLAADPDVIGAHLAEDRTLAPLIAARPGLRVPGAWDGFELAVRAVLGQQITVKAAIDLAGKLVAAYGEPLVASNIENRRLTCTFPRPERLAGADLSSLGMPTTRAAALSSLAAAVIADPEIFSARRNLEEAIVKLRKLTGVGEWTAQYIAMRELREPDAFPVADIGLMRALADQDGTRPSPSELIARAERWRPWRAYAAQYLWASEAQATSVSFGALCPAF